MKPYNEEYLQEPFQIVSTEARAVMEGLGKGADAYGMIHGDMYPENVLFKAGEVYPIDFEDCGFGHWLWDIAPPPVRAALDRRGGLATRRVSGGIYPGPYAARIAASAPGPVHGCTVRNRRAVGIRLHPGRPGPANRA
jgi:hypothetical protein